MVENPKPPPAAASAPPSRHRRVLILSVVTLVAALCAGHFFFYHDADAAYYRVTTDVETEGRMVRLDVVVRCGSLTVMRSIGGGGALDYIQTPYLYGVPTPGGRAILMRVPDFCGFVVSGDKKVQERWAKLKREPNLPLVMWAPDKDDLSRMTAYTSLEGYEGEGSHLRYVGTRYANATRDEWRQWKRKSGRPFVRRDTDPVLGWTPQGRRDYYRGFGLVCAGLHLTRVPHDQQDRVNAAWPTEKPLAWVDIPLHESIYTAALSRGRANLGYRTPAELNFLSGSPGAALLPYDLRTVLKTDEPRAQALASGGYVTIGVIDLAVRIRGRANCKSASTSYLRTNVFVDGDRIRQIDLESRVFIRNNYIVDMQFGSEVYIISGTREGMPP